MDVRSDEDVQRVIAHIVELEGRIDVVVNNAGILGIGERRRTAAGIRDNSHRIDCRTSH